MLNNNNNNNNNNIIIIKFNMHIRQGKVYLAVVGLNVPTFHWIRSILGFYVCLIIIIIIIILTMIIIIIKLICTFGKVRSILLLWVLNALASHWIRAIPGA